MVEAGSSSSKVTQCERYRFESIGVKPWLVQQCKEIGIREPSAVQHFCVPPALAGRDVIGCAKTGTGKTLAFALPILQQLAEDPFGIFALVLTPTRELAFQIADQFRALGKPLGLKDCVVVGGRDMIEQDKEIARKPHVLIATPGRLADHIDSGHKLPAENVRFLVLDEADRLLDGQYEKQLKTILGILPKKRQTLLFSATITDALSELYKLSIDKQPFFWEDPQLNQTSIVEQLDQRYVLCPFDVKDAYVAYVVKVYLEKQSDRSLLIFAHTCRECQALSLMFRGLGFRCGSLHSLIPQRERLAWLAQFRSSRIRILICTDVAARGLDIPTVDLVINHNVPMVPKNYIHRVGRAARAGRLGTAVTFVTQYDISLVHSIEELTKSKLEELKVNDKEVSLHVTEVLVAKREAEIKLDEINFGEKREVNKRKQMCLEGLDPDEVEKVIERQKKKRQSDSRARINELKKKTVKQSDRSAKTIVSANKVVS